MSETVVHPSRTSGNRARRLHAVIALGAIALGVAGAPGTTYAGTMTPTTRSPLNSVVVTATTASDAGGLAADTTGDLFVTMTCPGDTTAVGVTGEVQGFDGATINMLMPKGRQAVARATTIRKATKPWSLRASTLCVEATPDIEYVTHTWTISPIPMYGMYATCRPLGKELIGLGWATEGVARPAVVLPYMLPDPASGRIDTITMDSYGNSDSGARTQTATAVCAAPGNRTQVAVDSVYTVSGPNHTSASCPDGERANAVSPELLQSGPNGQLLRSIAIEQDGVTGSMDSVELDSKNTRGNGTAVFVLCVE